MLQLVSKSWNNSTIELMYVLSPYMQLFKDWFPLWPKHKHKHQQQQQHVKAQW